MMPLILLALALWTPLAWGSVLASYNFNTGQIPDEVRCADPGEPKVPPKIVSGALRMTASTGDHLCTPPPKLRVEMAMPHQRGTITSENRRRAYSFSVRFNTPGAGHTFLQLFQFGGEQDSTGPAIRMHRYPDGHVELHSNYNEEKNRQVLQLGHRGQGTFVHFRVQVVWSHDPSQGRVDVWVNGQKAGSLSGKPTNLGPAANNFPMMKIGMYSGTKPAVFDFDNVLIEQLSSK